MIISRCWDSAHLSWHLIETVRVLIFILLFVDRFSLSFLISFSLLSGEAEKQRRIKQKKKDEEKQKQKQKAKTMMMTNAKNMMKKEIDVSVTQEVSSIVFRVWFRGSS